MHAYRIAVDKGLIPPRPKARTPLLPRKVEEGHVSRRSPRKHPQTPSPKKAPPKRSLSRSRSRSRKSSIPSIFSAPEWSSPDTQVTNLSSSTSHAPTSNNSKRPSSYPTVIDRFAIDLVERSRTLQLNKGRDFWIRKRKIAESKGKEPIDFFYPALFRSVRICKTELVGHPVHLRSEYTIPLGCGGLRVGDAVFLNNEGDSDNACHISTQFGNSGERPRFILEHSLHLMSQAEDKSTYTCEASMDITEMVRLLCDLLFQRYFAPQSIQRRRRQGENQRHQANSLGTSATSAAKPNTEYDDGEFWIHDVDWTEIANEEFSRLPRPMWAPRERGTIDLDIPFEDADLVEFHERVEDIRWFHRECFMLEQDRSGGDGGGEWGITYRSTTLQPPSPRSTNLPTGLSPTPPATLALLALNLAKPHPFNIEVRWGLKAERMRMYCVAMYRGGGEGGGGVGSVGGFGGSGSAMRGRRSGNDIGDGNARGRIKCWLCFLVSAESGDLWELVHSRDFLASWRD